MSNSFDTHFSDLSVQQERAILVSISLPHRQWATDDPCDEIRGLAETAGAVVVGEMTQKRQEIQLGTYIGTGKLRELQEMVESTEADVICFDNDLTPAQARNLELRPDFRMTAIRADAALSQYRWLVDRALEAEATPSTRAAE